MEQIYKAEPLFAKIRSHLCHQDAVVDWNQMKKQHDELMEKVEAKEISLPVPDHLYYFYFTIIMKILHCLYK